MNQTIGCSNAALCEEYRGLEIAELTYIMSKVFTVYVRVNDTEYYNKEYKLPWRAKWEDWYPDEMQKAIASAKTFINKLPPHLRKDGP